MMGKSLELLGMASFNVFLGLVLTVTFLSQNQDESISRLTEDSVSHFIKEMADVSLGNKPELDQYGITTWFMNHIDDSGIFVTTMNITQPNGRSQQETLEMSRMDYISQVLKDIRSVKDREASLHIEYIKINEGGKDASVVFTNVEKGSIPVSNEGSEYSIPVTGTSYCEQKVVLHEDSIIKISGGTCTINVSMAESY